MRKCVSTQSLDSMTDDLLENRAADDSGIRPQRAKRKSMKWIRSKGAVPGESKILDSVRENRVADVQEFLARTKGLLGRRERKVVDSLGWGMVHIAVESGHLSLLKLLVESGLDPTDRSKPSEVPPLAIAVCSGNAPITAYLCSIPKVLAASAAYQVNFILANAASGSLKEAAVTDVRSAVRRRTMRYGQPFARPLPLWQAALLVGGTLEDAGRGDPFAVAYALQCTRRPGLAMLPSKLDAGLPLTTFVRSGYLTLLCKGSQERTGLSKEDACLAMRDLLSLHVGTYTGDIKPSVTLATVQATLRATFRIMDTQSEPVVEIDSLLQDVVFPEAEEEILSVSVGEEHEAYIQRMIEFKIWMLRAMSQRLSAPLHAVALRVAAASSQLRMSRSCSNLPMSCSLASISTLHSASPARASGSTSCTSVSLKTGLFNCIASHAPVRQAASLHFWRELVDIFGGNSECQAVDSTLTVVEELQQRKQRFSRSQATGSKTLEEGVKIMEGFLEVDAFLKEYEKRVND